MTSELHRIVQQQIIDAAAEAILRAAAGDQANRKAQLEVLRAIEAAEQARRNLGLLP